MSTQSSLQQYARTVGAIEDHIEANQAVFDAHKRLVMAEIDARGNVEDDAALEAESIAKEPVLAAGFRVVVVPQTIKVYNEEAIAKIEQEKGITLSTTQPRPPRIVISKMKEAD